MCRPRDCLIYIADTALTEFYTLSLHDALPISVRLLIGPTAGVQGLQVLPGPSLLPGVLCGSLSLTLGPLSGLGLPALADGLVVLGIEHRRHGLGRPHDLGDVGQLLAGLLQLAG